MAIATTNNLHYSWNTSQGTLQISIGEQGEIKAVLAKQARNIHIQQINIKGIPDQATKSDVVFHHFSQSVYPRLSQLGKQDYCLNFEGRLLGGGGKNKEAVKEAGKDAVIEGVKHVVAEAAAGTIGAAVVALLNTSTLNENAPYPEGPIRVDSPPSDKKKK